MDFSFLYFYFYWNISQVLQWCKKLKIRFWTCHTIKKVYVSYNSITCKFCFYTVLLDFTFGGGNVKASWLHFGLSLYFWLYFLAINSNNKNSVLFLWICKYLSYCATMSSVVINKVLIWATVCLITDTTQFYPCRFMQIKKMTRIMGGDKIKEK